VTSRVGEALHQRCMEAVIQAQDLVVHQMEGDAAAVALLRGR
jgi:hypothetical protein